VGGKGKAPFPSQKEGGERVNEGKKKKIPSGGPTAGIPEYKNGEGQNHQTGRREKRLSSFMKQERTRGKGKTFISIEEAEFCCRESI